MMPYHAYQVAQAERPQTEAVRRAADVRLGEMAAALAQLAATLRRPLRAPRGGPARPAAATAPGPRAGGQPRSAAARRAHVVARPRDPVHEEAACYIAGRFS